MKLSNSKRKNYNSFKDIKIICCNNQKQFEELQLWCFDNNYNWIKNSIYSKRIQISRTYPLYVFLIPGYDLFYYHNIDRDVRIQEKDNIFWDIEISKCTHLTFNQFFRPIKILTLQANQ